MFLVKIIENQRDRVFLFVKRFQNPSFNVVTK